MQELPERTTEIVRIRPTEEQWIMSEEYVKRVCSDRLQKVSSPKWICCGSRSTC